jgi:hypothetical protein
LAAAEAKFDAAAAAWGEVGDYGASGRYIKGGNRAESGLFARIARAVKLGLVSWPDTRLKTVLALGPHLAVTRRRGTLLSVAEARRGRRAAAGCPTRP